MIVETYILKFSNVLQYLIITVHATLTAIPFKIKIPSAQTNLLQPNILLFTPYIITPHLKKPYQHFQKKIQQNSISLHTHFHYPHAYARAHRKRTMPPRSLPPLRAITLAPSAKSALSHARTHSPEKKGWSMRRRVKKPALNQAQKNTATSSRGARPRIYTHTQGPLYVTNDS